MSITSMNARMGMAEKLSIQQLTKAVQDGSVPSFIGIPLIQQKMKEKAAAGAMQAQQPPVAQQVLQQAMATEGVDTLPSNMPESYAQGGILHYAGGGDIAAMYLDDEDDEDQDYVNALMKGFKTPDMSQQDEDYSPGIQSLTETKVSPTSRGLEVKESKTEVGDDTSSKLLKHILHKESRGQRYDKEGNLLTSSKGAMGEMQVMPATARDPGFGITPAKGNNPDELRRVGEEYAKVLLNKYRDPKLAAIAYNMGPGNTDKWLASGADMSKLPQETRGYIQNMAEGGIAGLAGGGAVHFQAGGFNDVFNMTPDEVKEYAKRKLRLDQLKSAFTPAPASAASMAAQAAPVVADEAAQAGRMYKIGRGVGSLARLSAPVAAGAEVASNLGSYKFQEPNLDTSLPGVYNALKQGNFSQAGRNLMMGLPEAGMDVARGAAGLGDYLLPGQPLSSGLDRLIKSRYGENISTPSDQKPYDFTQFDEATDRYMKEREKTLAPSAASSAPSAIRMPDMSSDNIDAQGGQNFGASQVTEKPEIPKAPAETGGISDLAQELQERKAGLGKQRDIDNYMALLSAGLGMMGGTSPFAGANIGQGAQAGIKTYADSATRAAAENNAILSGRLGLEKYQALAKLRKENQNDINFYRQNQIDFANRKLAQSGTEKANELDLKREKEMADQLEHIEKSAMSDRIAKMKDTIGTPEQKAQIEAQALNDLRSLPWYRELHKQVRKYDPMIIGGETKPSPNASVFNQANAILGIK